MSPTDIPRDEWPSYPTMTTPDPLRAALAEIEELYISPAKPPVTHDWCRLCRSANDVAGQPIDHWHTCPIAIVAAALAADTAPLDVERLYAAVRPEFREAAAGGGNYSPDQLARDATERIYARLTEPRP